MSEPIFLRKSPGLTLDEVVALTGATLRSAITKPMRISNIAPLDRAGPGDLTFFDSRSFSSAAAATHAGACVSTAALAKELPSGVAVLVVREPYKAFVTVARALFPDALRPSSLVAPGERSGAHIDANARMEEGVTVEPGAVVGAGAEIGSGTVIGANSVVGTDVRIGRDCVDRCEYVDLQYIDRRSGHYSSRLQDWSGWIRICDGRKRPSQSAASGPRDRTR